MNNNQARLVLILISLLLAFMLAVSPLPDQWRWLRPNFVALVLIYWVLREPEVVGITLAWLVGLILDGVTGVYLGQHALSFAIIAYVVIVLHKRLRMFSVAQQAMLVFILLGLDQMINGWIDLVLRGGREELLLLMSAVIGGALWPVVVALINRFHGRLSSSY